MSSSVLPQILLITAPEVVELFCTRISGCSSRTSGRSPLTILIEVSFVQYTFFLHEVLRGTLVANKSIRNKFSKCDLTKNILYMQYRVLSRRRTWLCKNYVGEKDMEEIT
jgi:hypothetical protein